MRLPLLRRWPLPLLAAIVAAAPAPATAERALEDLSLEELMDVEVSGASRFEQPETQAPASVSVVTSEEIRRFGWRTLAEVLRSVRGFYVSSDYTYAGVGVRGFGALADYNGRILLLVDGHRINEPVYDSTPLGNDGVVDLDLVERIEIVRGSSSSLYGSNAFFGVVNVITRRAAGARSGALRIAAASARSYAGGASWSGPIGGVQLLAGVSGLASAGRPEIRYPGAGGEVVRDLDAEHGARGFLKGVWTGEELGTFTLQALASTRRKQIPTDMWLMDLGAPDNATRERRVYLDGSWTRPVGPAELTARAYLDAYAYDSTATYGGILNRDFGEATWAGAEAMFIARAGRHVLTLGAEARDLLRRSQRNHDVDPHSQYLDVDDPAWVVGAFVQDELRLGPVRVNAGIRHDRTSDVGSATSPRAAVIWQVQPSTTLKVLYGRAYRAPNAFEAHFETETYRANPDLRSERIDSFEAIVEQQFGGRLRLVLNAYHYDVRDLVTEVVDADDRLTFANLGEVRASGVEAEVELRLSAELRGRFSYALQRAEDAGTGETLFNSPAHLAKGNVVFPLWPRRLLGALEGQLTSPRRTSAGEWTDAAVLVNASVLAPDVVPGLDLTARLTNVFADRYWDPAPPDYGSPAIRQDGLQFRVSAKYRF
ncbi:MAG TPA: TonB-dependent receptor [Anaeromyxobacter sp.]|nr:TonB-dependent receptor [Anaeromyxobacter sp.]